MAHKRKPNPRIERAYQFIRGYLAEHGYGPSTREIGDACGISSTSIVDYYLEDLERQGRITRTRGIARSIVLTDRIAP
jgi:repressor LexA